MTAVPDEDLDLTEKQFGKRGAGVSVTGSSLTQLMLQFLLVSDQNLITAKEERFTLKSHRAFGQIIRIFKKLFPTRGFCANTSVETSFHL